MNKVFVLPVSEEALVVYHSVSAEALLQVSLAAQQI